jgi:dopamine beta-monooxygenase
VAADALVYLLVLSFQGEWDLQPLPEIISMLEEPTPQCPNNQAQSPGVPTVVSIGRGRG